MPLSSSGRVFALGCPMGAMRTVRSRRTNCSACVVRNRAVEAVQPRGYEPQQVRRRCAVVVDRVDR